MSLPATDRLTRALGNLHEQMLRLEADATKCGSPEAGDYPAALGLLLGSVRGRLEMMDYFLAAAQDAASDVWDPCTHEHTRCVWCDEAAEQRAAVDLAAYAPAYEAIAAHIEASTEDAR